MSVTTYTTGCAANQQAVIAQVELCPLIPEGQTPEIVDEDVVGLDYEVCLDAFKVLVTGFYRKVISYTSEDGIEINRVACIPIAACVELPESFDPDSTILTPFGDVECATDPTILRGGRLLRQAACVRMGVTLQVNSSDIPGCGTF